MTRLFRRLADIISPPKPIVSEAGFVVPFGLTPSEWSSLKDLSTRPEWPIFLATLDFCVIVSAEQLLAAPKDESIHFHRGMVAGLRKAGTIIHEAIANENAWKNEQHQRSRVIDSSGRNVALFGSPAWRKPSDSAPRGESSRIGV